MKKLISILLLAAASSASAGVPYSFAAKEVVIQEEPFEELFRLSPYAAYRHSLGGGLSQSDDWGAGVSLYKPLGDSVFGIEGSYTWMEGNISDIHELGANLRVDLLNVGPVVFYALAGGGYRFNGSDDGWSYGGGAGAEYSLTERVRLWGDWRYMAADRPSVGDTGQARLGLSWSF